VGKEEALARRISHPLHYVVVRATSMRLILSSACSSMLRVKRWEPGDFFFEPGAGDLVSTHPFLFKLYVHERGDTLNTNGVRPLRHHWTQAQ